MFCSSCGGVIEEGALFCPKCGTKVEILSTQPIDDIKATGEAAPLMGAINNDVDISQYATFWQRAGAYIIDLILMNLIVFAIVLILALLGIAGEETPDELLRLLGFIVAWLYFATQESSTYQATVGKRILGIKVVDEQFHRIGFGRATGRFFSKILSALILLMGFIMVLFTKKRQGLHDMIAGTYVLNK